MQDSTKKLLSEADKRWGKPYRMITFLGGNFKIDYSIIRYTLEVISLNNVDIYCEQEDIFTGPFAIRFDKELNLERGNVKDCNWNEDDKILKINDEEIKFIDTDLGYFTDDVNVKLDDSINSLMKYFCEWVKRNYM